MTKSGLRITAIILKGQSQLTIHLLIRIYMNSIHLVELTLLATLTLTLEFLSF